MGTLTPALVETLEAFDPTGEPLSTTEVAETLELGRRSTYDRLDRLVDAEELRTKKVGASARVWWIPASPPTQEGEHATELDEAGGTDLARFRLALDASDVGIAAFGPDGGHGFSNEAFRATFGLDGESSLADLRAVELRAEDGSVLAAADRPVACATRTGESVRDQRVQVGSDDGDRRLACVSVSHVDADGLKTVVTTTDGSESTQRTRRLRGDRDRAERELEEFVERALDGRMRFDDDGVVTALDDRAATLLGAAPTALTGRRAEAAFEALPDAVGVVETALETGAPESVEAHHPSRDEWYLVEAVPTNGCVSVSLRDVTEAVARKRELERYVGLVDALGEPVYELDDQGRFRFLNDAAATFFEYSQAELLGEHVSLLMDDEAVARVESKLTDLLKRTGPDRLRVEYDVRTRTGRTHPVENRLTLLTDDDGTVRGSAGIVRSVSARNERKRELETYERIVETVDDGIYVLDDDARFTVVNDAFAAMAGLDTADLVGEHASMVFEERFVERANERQSELSAGRIQRAKFQETLGIESLEPVVVETRFTSFEPTDGERGRVGVVRDVSERVERERHIENQRAHLKALNEVNAVVRDVAAAVVEGSSREEIEAMVCDRLAASNSYRSAWVGEVAAPGGAVTLRASAAVERSLGKLTIATDDGDGRSRGPIGRAVRDRTVQVVQDASSLPASDPWRALADEHGFRCAAVIPITYDGTLYGVLVVHADRESAFADEERTVIEHIGEVVGHAIAAAERERALVSEAVVELDYRIPDAFEPFDPAVPVEGRITFDETVTTSGDRLLVYGTVSADGRTSLEALVDAVPYWEACSIVGTGGEDVLRFELRVDGPPVFSTVTERGGYIERVVVVDGDTRLVLHVPPGQDVRSITDDVTSTYRSAELVAQRHVSRPQQSMASLQERIAESLTERQRAALDAAYHSGFFEWPRDATGEDVADSLGIAAPTFNQHIRKAERKVLDLVLSASMTSDDDEEVRGTRG